MAYVVFLYSFNWRRSILTDVAFDLEQNRTTHKNTGQVTYYLKAYLSPGIVYSLSVHKMKGLLFVELSNFELYNYCNM